MSMLGKYTLEQRRARLLKLKSNVRKTIPPDSELRVLGQSVIDGQIHPCVISPDDDVYDGFLRTKAVMLINPEHLLDVIVVDRELAPSEIIELQVKSALFSTTLTSHDQALAIKEWQQHNPGAMLKDLGAKIGKDPSTLTVLNSLWRTAPEVIEAAKAEKIGPKAWYAISQVEQADQLQLLGMYLAGMPASEVTALVKKKRRPAVTEPAERTSRIKLSVPGRGTTVVVTGDSMDMEDLCTILEDILKLARKSNQQGLDSRTFERVCRDLANKEA